MKEESIVRSILNRMKRLVRYCWFARIHQTQYGKTGVPDLLFCVNGIFVGMEVKKPTGILTPRQKGQLQEISKTGGRAYVVCSADMAQYYIDELIEKNESCSMDGCKCYCHERQEVVYERQQFETKARRAKRLEAAKEKPLGRIGRGEVEL